MQLQSVDERIVGSGTVNLIVTENAFFMQSSFYEGIVGRSDPFPILWVPLVCPGKRLDCMVSRPRLLPSRYPLIMPFGLV